MKKFQDFKRLTETYNSINNNIIIIGGGPAGIATALALHQLGYQTLIIEGKLLNGYYPGEHVGPEIKQIFKELHIPDKILFSNSIDCYQIQSCWGSENLYSNESIYNPYGEGFLLSRPQFDIDMIHYVDGQGVNILLNTHVVKISPSGVGWLLNLKREGLIKTVRTAFIVNAGGRNSKFYKVFGATKKTVDHLVGITTFYANKNIEMDQNYVLLEAVKDGWWYSAGLAGSKVVATFFTDSSVLQKLGKTSQSIWQKQLLLSHYIKQRLSIFKDNSEIFSRSAQSHELNKLAGENWLAVGDSAISFDPLSSQGINKGLSMGINAAGCIDSFFKGKKDALVEYSNYYKKVFENYLSQRSFYYMQERRWAEEDFWKERVSV